MFLISFLQRLGKTRNVGATGRSPLLMARRKNLIGKFSLSLELWALRPF